MQLLLIEKHMLLRMLLCGYLGLMTCNVAKTHREGKIKAVVWSPAKRLASGHVYHSRMLILMSCFAWQLLLPWTQAYLGHRLPSSMLLSLKLATRMAQSIQSRPLHLIKP